MVLLEAGPVQEFAPDQYAAVTDLGEQPWLSVSTPRASETPTPPCAVGANSDLMNTISHPYGALQLTVPKDGAIMIFLLQEEITDGLEVFKAWFEAEAIPQIEAAGGSCLVCGVDAENENILHLVMEIPSMDIVEGLMASEDMTKARQGAGVLVETTQITVLKQ